MKKLMIVLATVASCGLMANAAAKQASRPVLALTAEMASFGEISQTATALGGMIGNPLAPALLLGGAQQGLIAQFGRFRSDSPMFLQVYVKTDLLKRALERKAYDGLDKTMATVIVYPSVDTAADMLLNNPGALKEEDEVIHLAKSATRKQEYWVKFTPDGKFCAFADSAEMAKAAAKNFIGFWGQRKLRGGKNALLRADLNEKGVELLASVHKAYSEFQQQQMKKEGAGKGAEGLMAKLLSWQVISDQRKTELISSFQSAMMRLDVDDLGISISAGAQAKPGAKTLLPGAGFKLPAGALDAAGLSPLFGAAGMLTQMDVGSEKELQEKIAAAIGIVHELRDQLLKEEDAKPYANLVKEIADAAEDLLKGAHFPGVNDWTVSSISFDAKGHPYLCFAGKDSHSAANRALISKLINRLGAALERQWPGFGIFKSVGANAWQLDLGAVVDCALKQNGVKVGSKEAKEAQNIKKGIATFLGSDKLLIAFSADAEKLTIAAPGVVPVAKAGNEAMMAAVMPEAKAERPSGVFCLTPYAFVRDQLLPIVLKCDLSKEDAAQYGAIAAKLPPAQPASALAGACWLHGNGSVKAIMRISAGEMKNLGAAFNAFTAAAMAGGNDADDDDDDDD